MPKLTAPLALALLTIAAVVGVTLSVAMDRASLMGNCPQLVAVTAKWLVDSINGFVNTGMISRAFIGFVLLPLAGNTAGKAPS